MTNTPSMSLIELLRDSGDDLSQVPDITEQVSNLIDQLEDRDVRDEDVNLDLGYAMSFAITNRAPVSIIKILLEVGADTSEGDYLNKAIRSAREPEVINELIKAGADVNYQDADGFSPLHSLLTDRSRSRFRERYGEEGDKVMNDVAKALLEGGADITLERHGEFIKDHDPITPLEMAIDLGVPLESSVFRQLVKKAQPFKRNSRDAHFFERVILQSEDNAERYGQALDILITNGIANFDAMYPDHQRRIREEFLEELSKPDEELSLRARNPDFVFAVGAYLLSGCQEQNPLPPGCVGRLGQIARNLDLEGSMPEGATLEFALTAVKYVASNLQEQSPLPDSWVDKILEITSNAVDETVKEHSATPSEKIRQKLDKAKGCIAKLRDTLDGTKQSQERTATVRKMLSKIEYANGELIAGILGPDHALPPEIASKISESLPYAEIVAAHFNKKREESRLPPSGGGGGHSRGR